MNRIKKYLKSNYEKFRSLYVLRPTDDLHHATKEEVEVEQNKIQILGHIDQLEKRDVDKISRSYDEIDMNLLTMWDLYRACDPDFDIQKLNQLNHFTIERYCDLVNSTRSSMTRQEWHRFVQSAIRKNGFFLQGTWNNNTSLYTGYKTIQKDALKFYAKHPIVLMGNYFLGMESEMELVHSLDKFSRVKKLKSH